MPMRKYADIEEVRLTLNDAACLFLPLRTGSAIKNDPDRIDCQEE